MSERFQRMSAVHTGGTKFYQIIAMRSLDDRKSVLITHWGKYPGHIPTPNVGETKVEKFDTPFGAETAAKKQRAVKAGRDYKPWTNNNVEVTTGRGMLDATSGAGFKASDRAQIEAHLGFRTMTDSDDSLAPKLKPEPKAPKSEKVDRSKDSEWSSW